MISKASLTAGVVFLLSFFNLQCSAASSSNQGSASPAQSDPAGANLSIPYPSDVLTYHYNVFCQGMTLQETTLTPSNVNVSSFGKVGFLTVDGKVDAQPLYVNKQFINGSLNDTVYVVTENDSVYAFSAATGRQFWRVSVLQSGETPSDDHGCAQISPQIGITDTPVIDKSAGRNGGIFFVAMTKDSSGHYHQRLHALDLMSGAELFATPTEIQATYPGTGDGSQNGMVIFNPGQFAERAGLLEFGSTIYLAFTSHCDARPYTGWIMAYNARTLDRKSVV